MLKIVTVPNAVLTAIAQPVEIIDERIKKLVAEMDATLVAQKDPQGVGLAAPQVGESLALFIIKPTPKAATKAFINPKILALAGEAYRGKSTGKTKKRKKQPLEGCLSVNRIWSTVKRSLKVQLSYQTLDGQKHTAWFSGFEATIIQHEVDHLNGILFTQRALEQGNKLYEEIDGELKKLDY